MVHLQIDNGRIIPNASGTWRAYFFYFTLLPTTAKTASLNFTKVNRMIKTTLAPSLHDPSCPKFKPLGLETVTTDSNIYGMGVANSLNRLTILSVAESREMSK
jgi:hypothetical protein